MQRAAPGTEVRQIETACRAAGRLDDRPRRSATVQPPEPSAHR